MHHIKPVITKQNGKQATGQKALAQTNSKKQA